MKKWFAICTVIWWIAFFNICPSAAETLTAPSLTNNPRLDVIVTYKRPLLTLYKASGNPADLDRAPIPFQFL